MRVVEALALVSRVSACGTFDRRLREEVEDQFRGMGVSAGGNGGRCMHSLPEHTDVTAMDDEALHDSCRRDWEIECPM